MSARAEIDLLNLQADLVERSAIEFAKFTNEFFACFPKKDDPEETDLERTSLPEELNEELEDCTPEEALERLIKFQEQQNAMKEAMEEELNMLETQKLQLELDARQKLSKIEGEVKEQKQLLKCYKTLLPIEFDTCSNKTTGFILNKNTNEFHGFVLDRENNEENKEYLWKQMENLFLKEDSD